MNVHCICVFLESLCGKIDGDSEFTFLGLLNSTFLGIVVEFSSSRGRLQ